MSILRAAAKGIAVAASRASSARAFPREGVAARMTLNLLLPCIKDHTLALGLLAYSSVQDGITCMIEHQYMYAAAAVCMLDGTTYKNIVSLVEIGLDVIRCILQCLTQTHRPLVMPLGSDPQDPKDPKAWADISAIRCITDVAATDWQIMEAASMVAHYAKHSCQVVGKELDHLPN